MKSLKMNLEFEVEDSKVKLFKEELIKKMHKFLAAHAVKVTAVDIEVKSK